MKYANYEIDNKPNEWGFYEAVNLTDCDAYILIDKTLQGLKDQIDDNSPIENIEFDDINYKDAPDFCDAFISYAKVNGRPLTEKELDILNDNSDLVYELLIEHLY